MTKPLVYVAARALMSHDLDVDMGWMVVSEGGFPTNWLDVLRSAMWPVVALLALGLFGYPLRDSIINILQTTGPAQEIEVGPVKLKLSAQAVRAIPPPSAAVAKALANLGPRETERLVSLAENSSVTICATEDATNTFSNDWNEFNSLKTAGLVSIRPDPATETNWCRPGKIQLASLSPAGIAARSYLLDIISKSLVIKAS